MLKPANLNIILTIFIVIFCLGCKIPKSEYSIKERADGGYTIAISNEKRLWRPITAEGFFPILSSVGTIEIIGKGKDFKFRGQAGYFYSEDSIISKEKLWDMGYAWIDIDREYIYLNLFWINSPDKLSVSGLSGKYKINRTSLSK